MLKNERYNAIDRYKQLINIRREAIKNNSSEIFQDACNEQSNLAFKWDINLADLKITI